MRVTLFLVLLSTSLSIYGQKRVVIGKKSEGEKALVHGVVKDGNNNELLTGATVYFPNLTKGVNTDFDGAFTFELVKGEHLMQVSMIGFEQQDFILNVKGNGKITVRLSESSLQLDEINITSEAPDENVKSTDVGKQVLSIKSITELPAFVGEVDILKSITLLPGVSTVGEASSGFNVRGGSTSQNLILLGGAPLYNPSHLFGFFSAFNADVIKDVTLYKGGIPAKYGGRGSSVLDITYKNGDLKRWKGTGSLGLISAKATVEGPIVKDKLSILLGGRTSYSNWLLNTVRDPDISNSKATFYDVNGRLNWAINDRGNLNYTYYRSGDNFTFASDTSMNWSNQSHILNYDYEIEDRISFTLSALRSEYDYSIVDDQSINQFQLNSGINNSEILMDFELPMLKKHSLNFGLQTKYLEINPGEFLPSDPDSGLLEDKVQNENALESGGFVDLEINLLESFSVSLGTRYSQFDYLGERTVYGYEPFIPLSEGTITDTLSYGKNASIISYNGIEPRVSFRWGLNKSTSIKGGYNKVNQYIHLISNTSSIAPTDIWKMSDNFLKPEIVTQYSLGVFKNFKDNSIESSVEVYYKDIENIIEYKDGADLFLNDNIETELLVGKGKTYGLELYVKKKSGKLTGWMSYTYSRSLVQVDGSYDQETINDGSWYSSNFDKPHDFTAVMVYNFKPRWSFSSNFTYSTGRPTTYPTSKVRIEGNVLAHFSERNGFRISDYHRLDISFTYKSISNRRILGGDWTFSVYNLYGRKNAFSVFFNDVEGAPPQPYKLSVLGIPFPSISYSFKF